jgi:hypothetical protein
MGTTLEINKKKKAVRMDKFMTALSPQDRTAV